MLTQITERGDLPAELEAELAAAIDEFAAGFMVNQDAQDEPLLPQDAEAPAEEEQEKIVKRGRG